MSNKLIQTDLYLLLIDEEVDIDINTYIVAKDLSGIAKVKEYKKGHILAIDIFQNTELGISYHQTSDWNKIIAYYPITKEAKELDLLLLPSFEEELDFWETVPVKWVKWNKKQPYWNGTVWLQFNGKNQGRGIVHEGKLISLEGDKISEKFIRDYQDTFYWLLQETDKAVDRYETGYKGAQPKQFSLEDIEKAFNTGCNYGVYLRGGSYDQRDNIDWEDYSKSLSTQQLPKEFIPYLIFGKKGVTSPQIITNAEGKEEICGTYKY